MKTKNKIFTILLLTSFLFVSCTKEDIVLTAGQSNVTANFSGNISGSFKSNVISSVAQKQSSYLMIVATSLSTTTSAQSFTISVSANATMGSHNISSQDISDFATFVYVHDSSNTKTAYIAEANEDTNFNYTITKNDGTTLEGTFKGDMFNDENKKITVDGTFKAMF